MLKHPQSNYYSYNSITQAVISLSREGPRMLFQGFTATALRDAPYAGIFLVVYEGFKQQLGTCPSPQTLQTLCRFRWPRYAVVPSHFGTFKSLNG